MCNGQKYHVSSELVPKKDNRHRVTQEHKNKNIISRGSRFYMVKQIKHLGNWYLNAYERVAE
jgi:hypothetical protein